MTLIGELKLRELYVEQKLSLAEIAARFGVSKQTIHYYIKKYKIDVEEALRDRPPKTRGGYLQNPKISIDEFIDLYTEQHLTLSEIAKKYDITRQAAWRYKKLYGIKAEYGTRVKTECAFCGNPLSVHRSRLKYTTNFYCSRKHQAQGRMKKNSLHAEDQELATSAIN